MRAQACKCPFLWAPVNSARKERRLWLVSMFGSVQAQSSQHLSDGCTAHAFSLPQRANPRAPQQPPSLVSSSKATWGSPLWFCVCARLPPSHETSACSRVFASPCTCSMHHAMEPRPKNRCNKQIKAIDRGAPLPLHLQPKCMCHSLWGNASLRPQTLE